jgi:hypothetical protein
MTFSFFFKFLLTCRYIKTVQNATLKDSKNELIWLWEKNPIT